jgi:hypothetical protein
MSKSEYQATGLMGAAGATLSNFDGWGGLQLSKRVPSRINRLVFDVIAGLSPSGRLGSGGKSRIPCQQESATQLCRCASLTLPELEQSKTTILDAPISAHSPRAYKHAIETFMAWYCSELRLGFNRFVVVRYRSFRGYLSFGRRHQSPSFRHPTSGR